MSEISTLATDNKHTSATPNTLYGFARDFITEYRAGALATVDKLGKPGISIVYCVADPDLTIYFSTRVEGRKFSNIMEGSTVALAFQSEKDVQMLQLSGIAQRVDDMEKEHQVLHELMKFRHQDAAWPPPPLKLFERGATNEIAIVKITPLEMTYADFKTPTVGKYKPFFQRII